MCSSPPTLPPPPQAFGHRTNGARRGHRPRPKMTKSLLPGVQPVDRQIFFPPLPCSTPGSAGRSSQYSPDTLQTRVVFSRLIHSGFPSTTGLLATFLFLLCRNGWSPCSSGSPFFSTPLVGPGDGRPSISFPLSAPRQQSLTHSDSPPAPSGLESPPIPSLT